MFPVCHTVLKYTSSYQACSYRGNLTLAAVVPIIINGGQCRRVSVLFEARMHKLFAWEISVSLSEIRARFFALLYVTIFFLHGL